ncbi:acetyl esterase/lipase [Kibdelosporangium banguiense]|uniref:Acetyl esterase/lipase n=1 Tax=Kibdelosporangium banguiense TaxID=1365924 RepID=A0ABS4TKE6_9PSEU|nr:alpha/beta hydrolase [Kibdelosporangium banguiense]MBP2324892.1 acetyl esterase/lipase [Kibdelosporangium banguiense]
MELTRVNPELRKAVKRVPSLPLSRTWVRRLLRAAQRRLSRDAVVDGVRFQDVDAGGTPARVYRPQSGASGAGLLWIHGGGLVMGIPAQDDRLCSTIARELGMVVVSVDYRLAPEDPFPAAIDDCATAWDFFQRSAEDLGVDPARIAIGGQSAGGGLAASLVHRIHDEGGPQPRAQLLFCPMLDDRTAARTELDDIRHHVWNNRSNRFGWRAYLGHPGQAAKPYSVAARREDLSGLPPAWVGVGDIDLFYDEDTDYARRLREAGVDCELDVVSGAPHGFESWAARTTLAEDFVARGREWLRRATA